MAKNAGDIRDLWRADGVENNDILENHGFHGVGDKAPSLESVLPGASSGDGLPDAHAASFDQLEMAVGGVSLLSENRFDRLDLQFQLLHRNISVLTNRIMNLEDRFDRTLPGNCVLCNPPSPYRSPRRSPRARFPWEYSPLPSPTSSAEYNPWNPPRSKEPKADRNKGWGSKATHDWDGKPLRPSNSTGGEESSSPDAMKS